MAAAAVPSLQGRHPGRGGASLGIDLFCRPIFSSDLYFCEGELTVPSPVRARLLASRIMVVSLDLARVQESKSGSELAGDYGDASPPLSAKSSCSKPEVPGLNWASPRQQIQSLMKTGSFFTSPRHSKSGRTSNRSHVSSRDTARRDVRPLTQIAEVLSAQKDAKQALQQVSDGSARELRECVKEFVATEATYAEDLKKVVDVFVEPLRALLPANLQYAIFSNLSQLHQLHVGLYADIVKGQEQVATDQGLACVQAFAKLLPYFKMCAPPTHRRPPAHAAPCVMPPLPGTPRLPRAHLFWGPDRYSAYCCNYPHVAEAVIQARDAYGGAANLIDEAEASRGVALQALLFRPVQRLCLYPLLLQKMARSSSEGTPMREACEKAFASIQSINSEVNEKIRQMEARLRMTEVLMHVEGVDHLVEASRQLHLEALVDMKCPSAIALSSWGVRRPYKWYVLSDYLLVCRPRRSGDGYVKKALWPLADVSVAPANGALNSLQGKWSEGMNTPRSSSSTSRTGSWNARENNSWGSKQREGAASEASPDSPQPIAPLAMTPRASQASAAPSTPRGSTARAAPASGSGKTDKPEVLRLRYEGVEYKCWASSESEMLVVVERLEALIRESRNLRRDLQKRIAAST
jgi:hypothetical protein